MGEMARPAGQGKVAAELVQKEEDHGRDGRGSDGYFPPVDVGATGVQV